MTKLTGLKTSDIRFSQPNLDGRDRTDEEEKVQTDKGRAPAAAGDPAAADAKAAADAEVAAKAAADADAAAKTAADADAAANTAAVAPAGARGGDGHGGGVLAGPGGVLAGPGGDPAKASADDVAKALAAAKAAVKALADDVAKAVAVANAAVKAEAKAVAVANALVAAAAEAEAKAAAHLKEIIDLKKTINELENKNADLTQRKSEVSTLHQKLGEVHYNTTQELAQEKPKNSEKNTNDLQQQIGIGILGAGAALLSAGAISFAVPGVGTALGAGLIVGGVGVLSLGAIVYAVPNPITEKRKDIDNQLVTPVEKANKPKTLNI